MISDGVIGMINFSQISEIIGGIYEQVIKKNQTSHEKTIYLPRQNKFENNIHMNKLAVLALLRQRKIGSEYLVVDIGQFGKFYNIKTFPRNKLDRYKIIRKVSQSKQIQKKIDFPFVPKIIQTYKDDKALYILQEYVRGQKLSELLREHLFLGNSQSQFYAANILLFLEYIHFKDIIFRNLKPSNITVIETGYLYFCDFLLSKYVDLNSKKGRTNTILGSPHYMAPEMILGQSYTQSVDLWSMGVMVYQFLCGVVPFGEHEDDPYVIYQDITTKRVHFPPFIKDKQSKKFILQLLSRYPDARLGDSFAELKAHQFFDEFDWDRLFSQNLRPKIIPNQEHLIKIESLYHQKESQDKDLVDIQGFKMFELNVLSEIQSYPELAREQQILQDDF